MKIKDIFASSLDRLPLNTRKIVTSALLTAVMALGASFHFLKPHTLSTKMTASVADGAAVPLTEIPARGLSRQRTDFEKALDILADAANSNPHLASYYKSVSRRVEGEVTTAESTSGVQAMNVRRDPPVDPNEMVDAVPTPPSSLASANTLPGIPVAAANEEPPVPSSALAASDVPSSLTVGDMTFPMNPAIEQWIHYYTETPRGRQTMTIGINRSNAYLDMARQEFRRVGVPEDLVWLAHVESVWNPSAMSPAAAGGIWQFIPKTAKEYGMTVESGNDERADALKQTRVAAVYLRDLYTLFGDWALAMAAYNSGEPRVMDAVVKNGRANFWEMYDKKLLPKETCNYVPKILAAIEVASHADRYGLATTVSAPSDESAGR